MCQPTVIVSQVVAFALNETPGSGYASGSPVCAVATYGQGVAEFITFQHDGSVYGVVALTPTEVIEAVRALRRTAQNEPERFATVNYTGGRATLVA